MDPTLPDGLDSAFEPYESGNYLRLAYSIFEDGYEADEDPYGDHKSSAFIERVDGRWFGGIEFADEHRGKGLSRVAVVGLCNYLLKSPVYSEKFGLDAETPIFIAADSSEGFWEHIGFVKNEDGTGPDLVSTLGRMCAWAHREVMPGMTVSPMRGKSEMKQRRRPRHLGKSGLVPYARRGGKASIQKKVKSKKNGATIKHRSIKRMSGSKNKSTSKRRGVGNARKGTRKVKGKRHTN